MFLGTNLNYITFAKIHNSKLILIYEMSKDTSSKIHLQNTFVAEN